MKDGQILIVGGGAAGFFAAITCAEGLPGMKVTILEKGREVLQKVKVSGGGRCNVTHACFDPKELVKNYPRGAKAMLGPFHKFQPGDTITWFEKRGVKLKIEEDGRMFPVSDSSQTIVDCLVNAAKNAGVQILTQHNVTVIQPPGTGKPEWMVKTQRGATFYPRMLMLASGGSPRIWELIACLGHKIVPPVPSLFTFNIKDRRIEGLAGLSVADVLVNVRGSSLAARGALLVTHWGLSGPAILRLSAWGAIELFEKNYKFEVQVGWLGSKMQEEIIRDLKKAKTEWAKKTVMGNCPFGLPNRLWKSLVEYNNIPVETRWADLSKEQIKLLSHELTGGVFEVNGKSTFKEEFVTAGGVHLDEVDFRTFQSKLIPGLFFAGEALDVDAITGGFNFQAAWTGGWLAGKAIASLGSQFT